MLTLSLEPGIGSATRQRLTAGQGEPGLGVARIIEPASKAGSLRVLAPGGQTV
jgi:hypothetical protein